MAGVSTSLRAYLWQEKPREQKEKREVWVLQGATYEGYRRYLQQAKEQGFPEPPRPPHDAIELARLPTAASLEAAPPPAAPSASALPPYSLLHSFGGRGGAAVSVVKFAPGSSDLLAWGGADGAVHVATAEGQPRLLQVLERHAGRVTDLDWAPDGTLLSCAEDGTACLWRPEAAQLLRTLRNGSGPLCCCRFHPSNPGLLLLGTAAGELLALNASTGRLMARAELQAAPMARFAGVGTCCLEAAGPDRLLVADSRGCLHLYSAEPRGGQLAQLAHFPAPSGRFHEPACLEFAGHSALAGGPAVLLALSSGEVLLLRLHEKPWRLELKREMQQAQQASAKIRVALRPGAAREQPELLLAGSEDRRVHLVDISRAGQPPALVAGLQAHAAPVLGVAWSEDESRLASCDKRGMVALWQRAAAPTAAAEE